jgi:transposase
VNTIEEGSPTERRRRRRYSDQFKAKVVAACQATGVSVAAVAMEHRLNANLLRRWIDQAEGRLPPGMPGRPAEVQTLRSPTFGKRRGTAVLNCAIEDAKVVPTIFE